MELIIESFSGTIDHACFGAQILRGTVKIVLGSEEEAKIDGKGVAVEILGEEKVIRKSDKKEFIQNLFANRNPRSVSVPEHNSFYANKEYTVSNGQNFAFEILTPESIHSSFKRELEDYIVLVEYRIKASCQINGNLVESIMPVYLVSYIFNDIKWFIVKDVTKICTPKFTKVEEKEVVHCCCMHKTVKIEENMTCEVKMVVVPVVKIGDSLNINLFFEQPEFLNTNYSFTLKIVAFLEIKNVEEEPFFREKLVSKIDFTKVQSKMTFQILPNEDLIERRNFIFDGKYINRRHKLVLLCNTVGSEFRCEQDLHFLLENEHEIAKSLYTKTLQEVKVLGLLEAVSYEHVEMYV